MISNQLGKTCFYSIKFQNFVFSYLNCFTINSQKKTSPDNDTTINIEDSLDLHRQDDQQKDKDCNVPERKGLHLNHEDEEIEVEANVSQVHDINPKVMHNDIKTLNSNWAKQLRMLC